MSVSGITGSSPVQATPSLRVLAPTVAKEEAGGDDALEKLQGVVKQLEGAANANAIPAHQSW